jgi:Domain of unknown function (DUF4912)
LVTHSSFTSLASGRLRKSRLHTSAISSTLSAANTPLPNFVILFMSEDSVEKREGTGRGPLPGAGDPENAKTPFDSPGELPSGYRQMFVIARDPHWLFTYWDFDYAEFPEKRQLLLRVFRESELETTIEINEIARNWYIPVQHADADYRVEFGWRTGEGDVHIVGEAGPTHTPPESISTDWDSQFATVPFHLGFNFLMEVIETAKAKGEPLTQALARLQQAATESIGGPSSWSESQLRILETLLGKAIVEQLSSMSSAELTDFLRSDLAAQLNSESASELLAKGRLAQLIAPEVSSLFSAFREVFGGEVSSAGLSSLGLSRAAESSETLVTGSESMASWQRAAGSESRLESSAGLSSLSVGVSSETLGAGSESLASWQQALGSESRLEQLSSLGLLGGLSSAELSSAGLSSFSGASELFAFGLSSAELSSGALSSGAWSGLEFPLSSWSEFGGESSLWSGFVSSWGGGPERSFFMHVNAEVIFYGGTDPRAKVSIAGQPIQLQSDGTFRYHFKFPDNDFEIPIVAVSPDGQETRSAVLYFRRETTRQGDVGSTDQPAHLGDPMGAKR